MDQFEELEDVLYTIRVMQQGEADTVSSLMKELGFGQYEILSDDIWGGGQYCDISLEGI